jgi:diacylglycerol kinase (ATP)
MKVRFTERTCHATELACEAVGEGFDAIVAVGGDGTLNEVVCGLDASGRPDAVLLGMIPSGTGGDFRKTSGFPKSMEDAVRYLSDWRERRVDYGVLSYLTVDGVTARRPFINIASIGLSGVTDDYVNHTTKAFGGKASFMIGAFRGIMAYRNVDMTVKVDGVQIHDGKTALVTMANGRFFGGGMMMAPDAELDDGMIRVVVLTDMSKLEFMALSGAIYAGTHITHPKCKLARGRVVEVETHGRALIDLDGEMPGMGPVKAEVVPGALRLMVPRT